MIKKFILYFAFFSIIIFGCKETYEKEKNILDWVPQNTSLIIKINDINEYRNEYNNNLILSKFLKLDENLISSVKTIIPKQISKNSILCFSKIGKEKITYTYIGNFKKKQIDTLDSNLIYSGQKIFFTKEKKTNLFITTINNTEIRSNSKLIIENCIRNYQNNINGMTSKIFNELKITLDNTSTANILINPKKKIFFKKILSQNFLFPEINFDWNVYDVNFDDKPISIDGLIKIQDSLSDPISLFKNLDYSKSTLQRIVPEDYTTYLSIPFKNSQVLKDNFKRYIRNKNIPVKSHDLNIFNGIDEIGWIMFKGEKFFVLHSKNNSDSELKINNLTDNLRVYRKIHYGSLKTSHNLNSLSKTLGQEINLKWGSKLSTFYVFSQSEIGMKNIIVNYKQDKTLYKKSDFINFKETLAKENSIVWHGNIRKIINLLKPSYSKEKNKLFKSFDFNTYNQIAFQGITDQNHMHLHLRIDNNENKKLVTTISNQKIFELDSPIANSPQWLKNHRNKNYDIAVQDVENNLYLISNTGKLLWKKKLNDKIIGKIQQIDLYKNKRLQMAFRTKNKFLILDRNGRIVKPFSINISSENPHPLSVFDYDKSRNYRFVLAQGKTIKMYNSKGKNVIGFKFRETKKSIINSPKHIRIKNKDYILIQESNGKLNILNRKGEDRIKINENLNFSENSIYSYLDTFTTTDNYGNLIQIDIKGNIIKTDLNLKKNNKLATNTKSLVIFSENVLIINGLPVVLPFGNYTNPKIFLKNSKEYISITDQQSEKIYLFDTNGKILNGFPIYGKGEIDLNILDNNKNSLELVVQSEKKEITIYKIN
ncbi:MAG: hypothetical protein P8M03_07185 [Flavobacteriaceae bacterium]|nr:hypothetical protein [Flavobacteriaceae bacterium]